ncbi:MAG: hypothetical protein NC293_07815 [Roseburia sp.]|nr:hypothetical protein [Roseburia sp.]
MNTLQSTISMIEVLPEADLLKIQDFAKKLSKRRELETADEAVGRFLPPKSKEDIYRDLEMSRQQAAEGKCQEMGEALAEIRARYGL